MSRSISIDISATIAKTKTLKLTFTDSNGDAYDISANTFELYIKNNNSDSESNAVVSKTDSDFTKATSVASVVLDSNDTDQSEGTLFYYVDMTESGEESRVLYGEINFTYEMTGEQQTNSIQIGDTDINIELNLVNGAGSIADAMTAKGDILIGSGSGSYEVLSVGADGQSIIADSSEASGVKWSTPSGSGDVVGPASSTDERIARFNGTSGKAIEDSGSTIADVLSVDNHTDGTTNKLYTASEKTKLSGIEDNATADQTAGEIKTAYESNADTNAFTDAEKSKLSGVESSADVTDTTNVANAGAVMTSGNQTINGTKTFNNTISVEDAIESLSELNFYGRNTDEDLTRKSLRIASKHYANDEENIGLIGSVSDSVATFLKFGALTGYNAVTNIEFFTASDNTTLSGTKQFNIDSAGVATFTQHPVGPSSAPTDNYQLANKKYVDDNVAAGGMTSFDITGDSGTPETITNGQTLDIAGGTKIDTTVGATDTVTVSVDSTTSTNIDNNTAHRTSTGEDHSYIDQDVTSGSVPTFTGTNFTGIPDSGLSSGATVVSAGSEDSGKLVKLDTDGNVDASTLNSADIDHDSTANFVANEHVDHTGVTLTAGTGLTGGGDISANRTFNVDVGIADDKIVQIDDTDAADDDYAKFTTNGIEGRSYAEMKTDLSLNNVENTALSTWSGSSNITTVGTLSGGDADAIVTDASTTAKGKVELATTAETTTGTDATRAVTPDGLKDGYQGSTNVTTLGTIGTGTWQGTAVEDTYVANDLTIAGGTIGTSDITLKSSATPTNTTDGTIEWGQTNNQICVGDGTNTRKFSDVDTIIIACSDESTDLTTGTAKVTFRMPNYAATLVAVRANVNTAPTGAAITVDINEGGTTVLSTKLTIDASEKTSTTAATPAVISDSALAADAEITIDIDQVGSTVAGKGLKVHMDVRRA